MNIDPTFNIDLLLIGLSSYSVAVLKMPSHSPGGQRELPFPLFYQNEIIDARLQRFGGVRMPVDKRRSSREVGDAPRSSFP